MVGDKAVLISIKPEWCGWIFEEEKDTEIRKNTPDLQCPFKVYIYCTKTGSKSKLREMYGDREARKMAGRVCAEFICDRFTCIQTWEEDDSIHIGNIAFLRTCLHDYELLNYLGKNGSGWGWHISKLKVYDEPRELRIFNYYNRVERVIKPPQSWCYVEELAW